MATRIPNEALKPGDVPAENADWKAIQHFALSFNAYEEHGSFGEVAKIANERRTETLTDLRTCLFFEQRRWRHFGSVPNAETMIYIRGLIKRIRFLIAAGVQC